MRIIPGSIPESTFKRYDENENGILDKNEIDSFIKFSGENEGEMDILKEGMDIYGFTETNLNRYREFVLMNDKDYKEGRQILADGEFISTDAKRQICEDDPNSALVEQGRYAIKKYSQDTPSMQTYHVNNCVVATIYDKETKTGFMAHFDLTETIEKLDKILDNANFNPNTSEVRIIGGVTKWSEGKIEMIEDSINKHNLKIVEYDILGEDNERNIQLDLNTGEVYDYKETEPGIHMNDTGTDYGIKLLDDSSKFSENA